MANEFVLPYKEGLDFTLGLYEKFLEICPDAIWEEKFGGWHVSQQFYHALGAASMFAATFTGQAIECYQAEAGRLVKDNATQPRKEQARELLDAVKKALDKALSELQNQALLELNPRACKGMGRDITNARVLALIDGHMLYHLGSCDAALRSRGLEGAF